MNNDYFIQNAIGIIVTHLSTAYYENNKIQFHTPMDYHLHNLLFYDDDFKYIGVLCLDINYIQTEPYEIGDNIRDKFKKLVRSTAEFFVDKIDNMIKEKIFSKEMLFDRSPQEIWDKFNELKQDTFIYKMPQFVKYLSATGVKLHEKEFESKKNEADRYQWAEIRDTEERIIEVPELVNAR